MNTFDSNTLDFDATSVEPSQNLAPLPPNDYEVMATEAKMAPLKSGNGYGLFLTFQVLSGEFKGRRVWQTLNIRHTNPKASEIAKRDLSALCRAIGIMKPHYCTELCNHPLVVTVRVRQQEGYAPSNEIKGYAPRTGNAVAAPQTSPSASSAEPATGSAKPSWM